MIIACGTSDQPNSDAAADVSEIKQDTELLL